MRTAEGISWDCQIINSSRKFPAISAGFFVSAIRLSSDGFLQIYSIHSSHSRCGMKRVGDKMPL